MVGTPPAETNEVNATVDPKMVHNRILEIFESTSQYHSRPRHRRTKLTTPIKIIAFLGCPLASTLPIQEEPGKIPSLAIAKTNLDAAVIAKLVFYTEEDSSQRR